MKKNPEFLQELVEPELKTPDAEDSEKEVSVSPPKKVKKNELQEIYTAGV